MAKMIEEAPRYYSYAPSHFVVSMLVYVVK